MSETERIVRVGAALLGIEVVICTHTAFVPEAKTKWCGLNLFAYGEVKFWDGRFKRFSVHCPTWEDALKELENLKCQKLNS